ncbi:hypothetical protein Tco_0234481, partial [Tanacetum coccineum]
NIMGEVDINTLTMEQYMALTRGNEAPGVVKPEIGGVTHDTVMLCVFPITLIGAAKRWGGACGAGACGVRACEAGAYGAGACGAGACGAGASGA